MSSEQAQTIEAQAKRYVVLVAIEAGLRAIGAL